MKLKTKEMIDSYYNEEISSQKLIQYIRFNEDWSNEDIYKEYHNIDNICKHCGNVMKYSGFKSGYRCSQECGLKRRKLVKEKEIFSKELVLKNITKCNCVSRKFLKEYNKTEKECYDLVYSSSKCNYCNNEARFINWINGYDTKCLSNECSKIQRAKRTKKTNFKKYGCENVSSNKEVQKKKAETFKYNYGVENISQLKSTQKKIRESMEASGRWVKLEDISHYSLYCKPAHFKHGFRFTNLTTDKEKQLLKENGIYNNRTNKNGVVRDHLLSRRYGFDNNIPTWIISHPANCEFVTNSENLRRASTNDNLITLEELLERIENCELI